ncbi:hypothetical protein V9T40_013019 [Parthenolecanium corni]|uniref:Muscleblind-like CCCH zinc finger domain-containing protein n=1 Tax=Parthenolecanium corni TaxID=536013 RepID=A0AAN9T889_9HEMI
MSTANKVVIVKYTDVHQYMAGTRVAVAPKGHRTATPAASRKWVEGRCNRDKPPCKYFHPPQHLKDQLLINGRNHLALKNALLQQMGLAPGQPMVPSQVPAVDVAGKLQFPTSSAAAAAAATAIALGQPQLGLMTTPYIPGVPQVGNTFNPYFSAAPIMPTAAILGPDPNNPLSMAVQQTVVTQQKMPRAADRLEPSTAAAGIAALNQVNAAASAVDIGRKRPHDPNDDLFMAFPGMVPYKRAAGDKSGVPVYQQSAATAYQQLLQPFVPVSCEYRLPPTSSSAFSSNAAAFTGISLNKQMLPAAAASNPASVMPAHSAAAAAHQAAVAAHAASVAHAASTMPRYHTSTAGQLNQAAFAHHFFPQLAAAAALRPTMAAGGCYPTAVGMGAPHMAAAQQQQQHPMAAAAASSHLSELLAAAQFSNMASGAAAAHAAHAAAAANMNCNSSSSAANVTVSSSNSVANSANGGGAAGNYGAAVAAMGGNVHHANAVAAAAAAAAIAASTNTPTINSLSHNNSNMGAVAAAYSNVANNSAASSNASSLNSNSAASNLSSTSIGSSANDEDSQPYKKLKTC